MPSLGLILAIIVAGCSSAKLNRPEQVALDYARKHFGEHSFNPDGNGYNINVAACGPNWCVQLYPARDPASGSTRFAGGGVHLKLRKSDLTVEGVSQTQ